jgi:dTDP-4-dehydrorhamnose 3,5-epimerase
VRPQGKPGRVAAREIFDVAVDLRRSSPTFGKWCGLNLSDAKPQMLWIPPGFAHGFRVRSESAHVLCKATDFYDPEAERTIAWNDPVLAIDWQLAGPPTISDKDRRAGSFREAELFGSELQ